MMKKAIIGGVVVFATLALLGCPSDSGKKTSGDDDDSTVGLQLTVSGIPSLDVPILAATLLKGGLTMENAVAAGPNKEGIFSFVEFSPPMNLGGSYTTLGSYYIILATSMVGSGINYVYKGSGQGPAEYTFTTTEATIPWGQFFEYGGEE
jgi:hypothetical protein